MMMMDDEYDGNDDDDDDGNDDDGNDDDGSSLTNSLNSVISLTFFCTDTIILSLKLYNLGLCFK